jgi:CRP-like cAMP-binding protein
MELFQQLQTFALFQGIREADIAVIAGLLTSRNFSEGGYLCFQGDPADCLFLIETGSVEVLNRVSEETEIQLAIRQEGDSIGEMALVEHELRFASVRCLEPVKALVLARDDLQRLTENHPKLSMLIMMNILREVSRRLFDADQVSASTLFGQR